MRTMLLAAALLLVSGMARADNEAICDKDTGDALDCYVYAISYTYRMCHQIQSIAVIEYGLTGASEGTNGKKYEFCVIKQKRKLEQPMKAALNEVKRHPDLVARVKELYQVWLESVDALPGLPGEHIEHYKTRVISPYLTLFEEGASLKEDAAAFFASAPSSSRVATQSSAIRIKGR